jgi:hypothetical protein
MEYKAGWARAGGSTRESRVLDSLVLYSGGVIVRIGTVARDCFGLILKWRMA